MSDARDPHPRSDRRRFAGDGVSSRVEDLRGEHGLSGSTPRIAAREFLMRKLRDDAGVSSFDFRLVTAVDNYLDEPRFEVVYCQVRSLDEQRRRARERVPGARRRPRIPTMTDLFPAANWMEREVYDMFGVTSRATRSSKRILMWEDFEGYPLRKDYPLLGNTPGTPGYIGKGGQAVSTQIDIVLDRADRAAERAPGPEHGPAASEHARRAADRARARRRGDRQGGRPSSATSIARWRRSPSR